MFHRVVHLKSVQKLGQNFILRLFALLHIRMLLGVIGLLYVSHVKNSRSIAVDFLECLRDEVFPNGAHISSHGKHQLIIRHFTVLVHVEFVEKSAAFFRRKVNSKVAESFPELLNFESSAAIVIHDLENSLHADNSARTPRRQLVFKHFDHLVFRFLDASVRDASRTLAFIHELHSVVATSHTRGSSSRLDVLPVAFVLIRTLIVRLPISLGRLLVERRRVVSAKQVSVMVLAVGFARVHIGNFATRSCKRHICGIILGIDLPCIGHH